MADQTESKQPRERSRAYPGATLQDCVEFTKLVKKALGKGAHDRNSLAKAMGFGSVSGAVSPKIAAMVHFGLLDRDGSDYELSDFSKRITDSLDNTEFATALREAFRMPVLYREILEKFSSEGEIPSQLPVHLHRFHGITDSASHQASEIFLASGRFAGVIDDANKIVASFPDQNELLHEVPREEGRDSATAPDSTLTNTSPIVTTPPLHVSLAHQRFEFSISQGRTVVLLVPSELNAKDIRIIRKQIELLELQAGIDE